MKAFHLLRCALVLATIAPAIAIAGLSSTEERIVAAVKERSPEAIKLLERVVVVNSGTMNHEGVREVGRLFRTQFDGLGFATRWSEMPPQMQRAGHLVAQRRGRQGRRLLLIGHLDTVFEKNSPVIAWDPRGTTVRGQGVYDMKGGDVIILEALRALDRVGALADTTISVVFSGDEERVGSPIEVARADLVEAAKMSDVALGFENTARHEGKETATIGRRASGGWTLKVTGRPGHSSGVFSERSGFGAIYEGARIVNAFREELIEPNLTFNPGVVVGGTYLNYDDVNSAGTAFGKTNVIAHGMQVEGDLRYIDREQGERARARMREIVARSLPGTSAEITFRESYPPMSPTPGNLKLLEAYSQASVDAGLGPIAPFPPGLRGAGDVQFVAPYIDCLDGLGAAGQGAHTNDEEVELASIERSAIRAALLIYRLTRP